MLVETKVEITSSLSKTIFLILSRKIEPSNLKFITYSNVLFSSIRTKIKK